MRTAKYFNCTDRDRAAFEAMKRAVLAQPYVIDASVEIDRDVLLKHLSTYGYASLNERMLRARLTINYKDCIVEASISWIEELGYPLMKVDAIKDVPSI
jgi:hypothetical protein